MEIPFAGEHDVRARAPGYAEWRVVVRGRYVRDKRMALPTRLVQAGRRM